MLARWCWAVVICCSACLGGGDGPAEPGRDAAGPGPTVLVDGVVLDSLRGVPVPNASVSVGDTGTMTDVAGRFRLFAPTGAVPVLVLAYGHEARSMVLSVHGSTRSTITLRRLAPLLVACGLQADTIHALIVDLQGRKTLNRREGSTVALTGPSGITVFNGFAWRWTAIDNVTWRVRVPGVGDSVSRIAWQLRDTDGNLDASECSQVAAPPLPEHPDSLD